MQLDKKKVLFSCVLLIILIYLISNTYNFMNEEEETPQLTQPELPEWQETEKNYESKKAALDAFKKASEATPPSLYDERMIDDKGYFNPDYMLYEKHRIIDSLFASQNFQKRQARQYISRTGGSDTLHNQDSSEKKPLKSQRNSAEMSLDHQVFFSIHPKSDLGKAGNIKVSVLGNQVLKKNSRIQLQLAEELKLSNNTYPKNTPVWGRISFGPNRVLVTVSHIHHQPIALEAVDLQDGMKGIYIENSFRSEASREVLDDVAQDVNIPGLPQINGLKQVFQRSNRKVKVTVLDGYELLLYPKNQ